MNLKFEHNGFLTDKDKRLIVIMLFIVIALVFSLCIIKPLYQTCEKLAGNLTLAEAERDEREIKIMLLGSERSMGDALDKKISDAVDKYYPMMDSKDVDRMFTSMALERGLSALDLKISMPTDDMQDLAAYRYSKVYKSDDESLDEFSHIYTVAVTFTLGGSIASLQEFIDYIYSECPVIRIKSYNWSNEKPIGEFAVPTESSTEEVNLIIDLDIYMSADKATNT